MLTQIESQDLVDNIDAIAAVDGVDGILSAVLGYLGAPQSSRSAAGNPACFSRARAPRKPSVILAPTEADTRLYLKWGARFVAVGSDLGMFCSATQSLCYKFKG